jgi:hypothetical protein
MVKSCPLHAECLGGMEAPLPERGYWVDHSDYKYAGELYRCARSTCKGGTNHSSCWTLKGFNASGCGNNQCTHGAKGPLCASCADGFVYRPITHTCDSCSSYNMMLWYFFGCLMFIGSSVYIIRHILGNVIASPTSLINSGTLKVLWVTYQIVVSASFTLNIKVRQTLSSLSHSLLPPLPPPICLFLFISPTKKKTKTKNKVPRALQYTARDAFGIVVRLFVPRMHRIGKQCLYGHCIYVVSIPDNYRGLYCCARISSSIAWPHLG